MVPALSPSYSISEWCDKRGTDEAKIVTDGNNKKVQTLTKEIQTVAKAVQTVTKKITCSDKKSKCGDKRGTDND